MQTTLIEKLSERGINDNKNILNRATNVSLSNETLEQIENEGITSEQLDTLGVPVFKYGTQITVHGIFPDLNGNGRLGGYKYIFQNKNKSLGIKYNAIDAKKKHYIYDVICKLSDYIVKNSSTEHYIYKMYRVNSIEDAKVKGVEVSKEINKINKNLFFGYAGVNILRDMFGQIYIEKYVSVNAIYQKNVDALIANVLNININEIDKLVKQKDAEREAFYKQKSAEYEAEKQKKIEAEKPFFDAANKYLSEIGYTKKEKIDLFDGLIVLSKVSVNTNRNEIEYTFRKYTKTSKQKKFHYVEDSFINNIPSVVEIDTRYCGIDYTTNFNVVANMYTKDIEKNVKQPKTTTQPMEVEKKSDNNNINFVDVKIVDYSEKSFVVIGNTKPIKEMLKQLGGKFNPHLTCGLGWIFSKSKKEKVLMALK